MGCYTSDRRCALEGVLDGIRRGGGRAGDGELAAGLGTTAGEIRGHVGALRALGYRVESAPGKGYRLAGPAPPLPWEVRAGLGTTMIGRRVIYFDTVGSTQKVAVSLAGDAWNDGTVVVAGTQTGGMGRKGAAGGWESPRGGIWMSAVHRPGPGFPLSAALPLAASVALAEAVRSSTGIGAGVKWPNDVVVGGRKAAGVMVDASAAGGAAEWLVIGAGINFNVPADRIEERIRGTGSPGVASLAAEGGAGRGPVPLVQEFLRRLEAVLESLRGGGVGGVLERWTGMATTIGRDVSLELDGRTISGVAESVDGDGRLVVATAGGCRVAVGAGDLA